MLLALFVLLIAAGLILWAMHRSTVLTERLHPLTPEQRQRKRKAYAMLVPIGAIGIALGALITSGGAGALVAIAVLGAILLADALLTPWLHYRRARRKGKAS